MGEHETEHDHGDPLEEPLAEKPEGAPAIAEVPEAELPEVELLAAEPDYPPPGSVPVPPPPVSLRVYPPPVVEEIAPAKGSVLGGTKITLTGQNLFRATIVRVNGVIAQTVGASEPRELRVLAPESDRPGQVDLTIENPYVAPAVLVKAFRYEPLAAPKISSVAPDHVATKGGEISVNGEHFVPTTAVLLDGKPAGSPRFVSAGAIDVKVPPGEDGKMVDVTVKNPDGQTAVARRAFVYDRRYG